jgi:hypothetical protein
MTLKTEVKMTDKIPTKIPIDLDRRRYFNLNLTAVAFWEANTGKPFVSNKTWKHLSDKEMVLMLWACLKEDDPTLKPKDIVQMVKDKKLTLKAVLPVYIRSLSAAWAGIFNSFTGGDNHAD